MHKLFLFAAVLTLATSPARAQGAEPSPERIAFRYDDSHVIVRLDQAGGDVHDNPADQLTPLPRRAPAILGWMRSAPATS
jgi:hypothetical protein